MLWDLPTKRGGEEGQGHGTPEVGTGRQSSKARGRSPGARRAGALQGLRALHHLAQDVVDVRELGSLAAVLLPAVEHELVEGRLAVHRGRQAEPILHGLHHLQRQRKAEGTGSGSAMQIAGKPLAQASLLTPRPGSSNSSSTHHGATCTPLAMTTLSSTARPPGTHVLVGHVPVGSLAVGHDFPHDDAEAPHVAGRTEVVILDGFRGRPQHQALPTLERQKGRNDVLARQDIADAHDSWAAIHRALPSITGQTPSKPACHVQV